MALLKSGSKPIAKRKPRRVFRLQTTLDQYKIAKLDHESKQRPQMNMN